MNHPLLENVRTVSLDTDQALEQFVLLKLTTPNAYVVPAASNADEIIGVSLEGVTAGDLANSLTGTVAVPVALVESGGKAPVRMATGQSIGIGFALGATTGGRGITHSGTKARAGLTLTAANGDELVQILFDRQ